MKTSDWILEGYDSEEEYNKAKGIKTKKKGKTFKLRRCPKCNSDEVVVVLGELEGKGTGTWGCKKCKWSGADVKKDELNEDKLMKYLDDKGVEVS